MNSNRLKEVIDALENYESIAGSSYSTVEFVNWWQQQLVISLPSTNHISTYSPGETTDSIISKYLIFMNRYAKMYGKWFLQESGITNLDEFSLLIYLFPNNTASKMELIEKNVMEKNTGIEMLNRLIKKKLLIQQTDGTDKRTKILTLSNEGRELLLNSFQQMNHLAKTVTGNLADNEKMQLVHLLEKLHLYHLQQYMTKK